MRAFTPHGTCLQHVQTGSRRRNFRAQDGVLSNFQSKFGPKPPEFYQNLGISDPSGGSRPPRIPGFGRIWPKTPRFGGAKSVHDFGKKFGNFGTEGRPGFWADFPQCHTVGKGFSGAKESDPSRSYVYIKVQISGKFWAPKFPRNLHFQGPGNPRKSSQTAPHGGFCVS